jgi:hypothetical protein
MADLPLLCPSCATAHPLSERFCRRCGMPLVYAGAGAEQPVTERHARARKIRPEFSRGPLARAGRARNQAEAELIQGMLLEEGIPSLLKRTRGFDVPDFLAAGPRDVLVPESGLGVARELLAAPSAETEAGPRPAPLRLAAALLVGVAVVGALAWVVTNLT